VKPVLSEAEGLNILDTAAMAALQQIHLCIFRCRFGEADTDADQSHWFGRATKCFIEKSAEVW
jgi:hypothetical protein